MFGRDKDGGAFVKISFKLPETPYAEEHGQEAAERRRLAEREALAVIEKEIVSDVATLQGVRIDTHTTRTQSNSAGVAQFKPWWAWQPGRALLVKVSLSRLMSQSSHGLTGHSTGQAMDRGHAPIPFLDAACGIRRS